MTNHKSSTWLALAATGTIVAGGIVVATGPARLSAQAAAPVQAISATDKAEGAKAHPQLLQEFGGPLSGPQASYVEGVGKIIAVQSGLSNARGDFTVTLLNSSVNNAFAIPGGYVYVTRQLVSLMNNEAELAGVLGHEVGHVAARHSDKRQAAATRNSILGALGQVLVGAVLGANSAVGQLGQKLFSTGSQLLTLRYSRGQESEADRLGVTYLKRAGYDPRAMSSVLQSLAAQTALDAQIMGTTDRMPEWASTHPDPASRVRAALSVAQSLQGAQGGPGMTNRDVFLSRIDGLVYGDDPNQGLVEGRTFTHPALRLEFTAPAGFYLVNGARSVSIAGQTGKGEFAGGTYSGDLGVYVRSVFAGLSDQGQLAPSEVRSTTVNGIPAAYGAVRTTSGGNQVDVVVFAYAFAPGQAYHFLTISQAGQAAEFDSLFQSLHRLDPAQSAAVKPRRLTVVTVRKGETSAILAKRMAYTDQPLQRFLVLNALSASTPLQPGQRVKLVVR